MLTSYLSQCNTSVVSVICCRC